MRVVRALKLTALWGATLLCGAIAFVIGATGAGVAPKPAPGKPVEVALQAAPGEAAGAAPGAVKGWQKGKGWGWTWGKDDEVGALNAMTDASRAAALALATRGETFDLG